MSVRVVVTEYDLGSGWKTLLEQARQRKRSPGQQAVAWLRYAAAQARDGKDVELSQARLDALLDDGLAVA